MTRVASSTSPHLHSASQSKPAQLFKRSNLTYALIHLVLISCAITMLFPLVWLVSTSLKHPGKQFIFPPELIPNPVHWQNYVDLFSRIPMGRFLWNSFEIATLSVIGVTLSSALAAFAFARMRFRGREILFSLMLVTMMIPSQVTVIPTFVIMRTLGWIDTHAPLIVPSFFGSAFAVFLLRQFYRSIPQDLMDAATIDGASFFRIFWEIFIPLGMPALATIAVFSFLGSWNDLFGPLIYLNSQDKMTVTLGLTYLRGRTGTSGAGSWGIIMAGSLLGVIPMLILYSAGQRYFVQGLARTGLKG
jgi:ABC-type glycerol-3-phosphate transport system permease component